MNTHFYTTKILYRAAKYCSFLCFRLFSFSNSSRLAGDRRRNKGFGNKIKRRCLRIIERRKSAGSVFDLDVIRIRIAPNGIFEKNVSYAIDYSHDRKTPSVKVSRDLKEIILTNYAGAKVVITKKAFLISVFDEHGEPVIQDDSKHPTLFNAETGEIQTSKLRRGEVETYYGFGEKAFAEMSRNSKYIVNWNTDTFAYPIGTDPDLSIDPVFLRTSQRQNIRLIS